MSKSNMEDLYYSLMGEIRYTYTKTYDFAQTPLWYILNTIDIIQSSCAISIVWDDYF